MGIPCPSIHLPKSNFPPLSRGYFWNLADIIGVNKFCGPEIQIQRQKIHRNTMIGVPGRSFILNCGAMLFIKKCKFADRSNVETYLTYCLIILSPKIAGQTLRKNLSWNLRSKISGGFPSANTCMLSKLILSSRLNLCSSLTTLYH